MEEAITNELVVIEVFGLKKELGITYINSDGNFVKLPNFIGDISTIGIILERLFDLNWSVRKLIKNQNPYIKHVLPYLIELTYSDSIKCDKCHHEIIYPDINYSSKTLNLVLCGAALQVISVMKEIW
jgi:hypothetical protein